MPLDTSTYSLALLRVDGRRWNELRRLHAQIRTQDAADGSSYLEMGHTKVMCVVTGPAESNNLLAQQQQQQRRGQQGQRDEAAVNVNIVVAGFSSVDRKKRARSDKSVFHLHPVSLQLGLYQLLIFCGVSGASRNLKSQLQRPSRPICTRTSSRTPPSPSRCTSSPRTALCLPRYSTPLRLLSSTPASQ
jgi:exosome complex component RRP41